jgi:hypothetical protein
MRAEGTAERYRRQQPQPLQVIQPRVTRPRFLIRLLHRLARLEMGVGPAHRTPRAHVLVTAAEGQDARARGTLAGQANREAAVLRPKCLTNVIYIARLLRPVWLVMSVGRRNVRDSRATIGILLLILSRKQHGERGRLLQFFNFSH